MTSFKHAKSDWAMSTLVDVQVFMGLWNSRHDYNKICCHIENSRQIFAEILFFIVILTLPFQFWHAISILLRLKPYCKILSVFHPFHWHCFWKFASHNARLCNVQDYHNNHFNCTSSNFPTLSCRVYKLFF